jgi:hypothetical protein
MDELGTNVGADVVKPIFNKNPQPYNAIGGNYEDMQRLAENNGAETRGRFRGTPQGDFFGREFPRHASNKSKVLFSRKQRELEN